MRKRMIVTSLLIGVLLLSVPLVAWAYGNFNFWNGNQGTGTTGYGIMRQGMMGSNMMGNTTVWNTGVTGPVNAEKAKELVNNYIASTGLKGISLAEIMEFETQFYAELKEDQTGMYAEELIIDKQTGALYPEMGPNMMWNTKYGHMGGLVNANAKPTVSPEEAIKLANNYLVQSSSGETAAEPHEFYGYYTLHTFKNGNVVGMLSVNSYTGQVWYHTWHGKFVTMYGDDDNNHSESDQHTN